MWWADKIADSPCTLHNQKHGSTKEVQNTEVYMDVCFLFFNDRNQEQLQSEVGYSSCNTLHGTIGHQAVYTSLWLTVSLGISFFNVCRWKKWLVHVRIHNPVWKFLIDVLISLDVQALVLISCLEHFHNPAATSWKQWHSRENFVQNQCKIQEWDYSHKAKKLNRKR